MSLDDLFMDGAEKLARLYQDVTGKHKNNLAYDLYVASIVTDIVGAVISAKYVPVVAAFPLAMGCLDYMSCKTIKEQLEYTENVPPMHRNSLLNRASSNGALANGAIFSASSVMTARMAAQHSYGGTFGMWAWAGIDTVSLGFGISSLAGYIWDVNIEPPSGKSVFVRMKEKLEDFATSLGRSRQPVPESALGMISGAATKL